MIPPPGSRPRRKTPEIILRRSAKRKAAFLKAIAVTGSIRESASLAGIDPSTHTYWLETDPTYKAPFNAAWDAAGAEIRDDVVNWARKGIFEPIVYKGEFQFASRKRTMCLLADGTQHFEDELPKGAIVVERRTVRSKDGEMLGIYRRSENCLLTLLRAHFPAEFGNKLAVSGEIRLTTADETKRELLRKLTRVISPAPGDGSGPKP